MKEIRAELNNDGFAVNTCPHLKMIKLGGFFCCKLCKYFIKKDVSKKVLVCGCPFDDEFDVLEILDWAKV